MKVKLAMCYNTLIDKMGARISSFRDLDTVVKAVAGFMNEGAIEVRNVAKLGLLALKNHLGSQ